MKRWTIDPTHSEINFKVKHLVVSTVTGQFDKYTATIDAVEPDFSDALIAFEADVNTINTGNAQRDAHLKSPDFFNAELYPKMSFVSKSVTRKSANELSVVGDLTIAGKTNQVELAVIHNGTVAGFGGATVAGFEVKGAINRFDFGLHWNAMTEAGGVIVSDTVKIEILAEMTLAREAQKAA